MAYAGHVAEKGSFKRGFRAELAANLETRETTIGSAFILLPPRRYSAAVGCLSPEQPKYTPIRALVVSMRENIAWSHQPKGATGIAWSGGMAVWWLDILP